MVVAALWFVAVNCSVVVSTGAWPILTFVFYDHFINSALYKFAVNSKTQLRQRNDFPQS